MYTPKAENISGEWVELFALFSIEIGTQLLVNCRGNHSLFLVESDTAPSEDMEGIELYPTRQMIVDSGSIGLWCRANKGKASAVIVQEDLIDGN